MKKDVLLKSIIAFVIGVGALMLVLYLTGNQKEVGEKEIQLIIEINTADEQKVLLDKTVNTDAETLAELLIEIDKDNVLSVTLDGKESDPYGRSLLGFADYLTEDWNNGPWWLYDSTTNKTCVDAGYCAGIDQTPIYDEDIFEFEFTNSFN